MAGAISYQEAAAVMEKHIQFVAKRIGIHWKWLGRELEIGNRDCVIGCIDAENKSTEEKAYQLLLKWTQAHGQAGATIETLIKALKTIEKRNIAEELEHEMTGWKPKIETKPLMLNDLNESSESPLKFPIPESPIRTTNGYILAKALVQSYKILQDVQELNATLQDSKDSDESSNAANNGTAMPIEKIQKSCAKMYQQIDETMQLILQRISDNTVSPKESEENKPQRPVSEFLQESPQLVNEEALIKSISDASALLRTKGKRSSRITTSKDILSRAETLLSLLISKDKPKETKEAQSVDDGTVPQLVARCESCKCIISIFHAERLYSAGCVSEHKQTSLDKNCVEEPVGPGDPKEEQGSLDQNCNQISKPAHGKPGKESQTTKL